jgi:hypothetical protein
VCDTATSIILKMVVRQEEENKENEEIKEIESGWQKRRRKQIGVFLLPLGSKWNGINKISSKR